MPSRTAATIYLFGVTALLAGISNLYSPNNALENLNLPITQQVRPATDAMGLAAIAMGVYYTLAAYQENRSFFMLTVPMRLLTATVFWRHGGPWRSPAVWEGGGAILTGTGLAWEIWRKAG